MSYFLRISVSGLFTSRVSLSFLAARDVLDKSALYLRRSLRGIVEVVAGFQPATTSTIPLKAGSLAGRHEQKDDS